jgi:Putative Ig domain/Beta-propeller repeat
MRRFTDARALLFCALFAFAGITTALHAADKPGVTSPHPSSSRPASGEALRAQVAQGYGDLPLSFEANQGQADARVRFLSRGNGYTFYLKSSEAVLTFSPEPMPGAKNAQPVVLRMQLADADSQAQVDGIDPLPGRSNYFFGKDPSQWRTGVPTFRKVAYQGIYPGINLVFYGNQRQLEYDFVVAPGADPGAIKLVVDGALKLAVQADGSLLLHSVGGDVRLLAPRIYQDIEKGVKHEIAGGWHLAGNNTASFLVATYDHSKALVIDPVLTYSSFLGGSEKNTVNRIVVDAAGNAYVAGFTAPGDFPAAPTPLASSFGGGTASRGAFVAKIDPTGSNLLYSTYLSGSADEEAAGLAVDSTGNVYVTGYTHSTDFPVLNAFQATCKTSKSGVCANAFLTKISANGNALVYSTYLGGSGNDTAKSLAVDAKGSAYVVGTTSSTDFPATAGSAQTECGGACTQNAFVAKFDPTGAKLSYATYLGGIGSDSAADIAIDASGNAYVTGQALSADFPLASAFQKSCALDTASTAGACVGTAFVTKIKADGSALLYSTYLGGRLGSTGSGIAVDAQGSAYVAGSTQSADFPVLKAFQKTCGLDAISGACSVDIFLTKFAASGKSLVYSTYLGGSGHDEASAIAVDASGRAHVVGYTESADFPVVGAVQTHLKGSSDAFVARFNAAGSTLEFSTYHGGSSTESGTGIAVDVKGDAYLAGQTSSADFPTSHPFQSSCVGACTSAFVTKMTLPQANSAPTITSANSTTFTVGTLGTFTVTTTGTPTPTTDDGAATLPTGVTYTDNGDGTGTLTGTPATGTTGNYPITFTATNGVTPDATQSFTLAVDEAPAITSGAATTFTVGTAGTFTLTATGTPAPTLSETGALPSGVTFNAGTGVLSGTPAAGTGGTYAISFKATNTAGNANQPFTLTVDEAPSITSAPSTTFIVGAAGTFTVTTKGFPAPALSETGVLPSGVTFVDNGDGTATLAGTPAAGTAGPYTLNIKAANTVSNITQLFALGVLQIPTISSTNATTFTVGTAGTFSVTTTGTPAPSIVETGALPSGVTFVDNGNGTGTLAGTAATGTGGAYAISLKATNTAGSTTQSFTLTVNEAASITSTNTTTLTAGTAGTFTVTTRGFPKPSLSETGGLPSGVTFVDNGNGTATLAGTPGAATGGNYTLNFTAHNGIGTDGSQSFTLVVHQPSAITSTNNTSCQVGIACTFTVTATGVPTPTLSETGTLPGGITFVDNGNGTATLAGTPAVGSGGVFALSMKATNVAATVTQSFTLTIADFSLALASGSAASSTGIQGQNALPLPVLALTSQNSYTGTVALTCPGANLPSGAACSFNAASNPLASNAAVNSTATITTATNMPVGNYSVTFAGTDAAGDFHTLSYPFSVECMFSLTNATYTPQTTGNSASFGFTVNETAGGSNCPWTAAATGSSVTVTSGSSGTDTAVGTGSTVAFQVATNNSQSTQSGTITATYFGGTSALIVSSEPTVTAANTIAGSSVTVNATASQTASNASIQFTTACGVVNASNAPDPTNNNFGITCSTPTTTLSSTGSTTVPVTITIPTGATAELHNAPGSRTFAAFYAFGLGIPGIVFLGLGTTAFGSGRKRFARRRWTKVLSILLVVILLALLASCSGGFNAMVVPKGTANAFTVTVMGVVTDSTGNAIGVEIFTIAVPVTPQV